MRWWHGAFSSTSKPLSTEDSLTSEPTGKWRSRLMRARKWRNSSETGDILLPLAIPHIMTPAKPQPLPVPELRHLLHDHDPKCTFSSVPLPSPEALHVPRGMERTTEGNIYGHIRLIDQDHLRMNMDHPKSRPARRSLEIQRTPLEKSSDIFNFNINIIPISAPTSPYGISPPTSDAWSTKYPTPPGVFHVWSAPEIPHSDIGSLRVSYSSQTPPLGRNSTGSLDNSPLDSPHRVASRISAELMRWESNAQANVHPLPLPPPPLASVSSLVSRSDTSFATMPSHTVSIPLLSSFGNKPEVVPRKSKWQKGKLIGRGTFGSVYVASNRETGALCAMKEVEILPDDSKSAECIRQMEQEIKVLQHLKHPNIVQYYGSEIVGDKFYIYLEYVHPGSINKFIQDHCGAITESVVRNFTRHILCGLAYLHSKKTIHRDIKGANLLVDAYGVVKLADFGMAKHLNGKNLNLSLKGTPHWLAPEVLLSTTQTDGSSDIALAVDIWSLGCTIIEMMDGKPPWSECEGAAALFKVLKESPPIPNTMSAEGQDFLQCCFRRNPADRPTAAELLDHPFVNYSHQPHASTQPLKEIKFTQDNMQFRRERTRHKSDQMHTAYDIRHEVLSNNFMHDYVHLLE